MLETILGSAQANSGETHRNQQTITCQVLAELIKIWSCLIPLRWPKRSIFLGARATRRGARATKRGARA